jgi:hypothetical protein
MPEQTIVERGKQPESMPEQPEKPVDTGFPPEKKPFDRNAYQKQYMKGYITGYMREYRKRMKADQKT